MKFLRISGNNEEFLLNISAIRKISKGGGENEFLILLEGEEKYKSYKIYGEGGKLVNKLLVVKKQLENKE